MLTLMTLIQSFGQSAPDTVRCYGFTELQHISATMTKLAGIDTLLQGAKKQLIVKDSIISQKDTQITTLETTVELTNKVVALKESEIADLNKKVTKLERHKKLLKLGLLGGFSAFSVGLLYILVKG